jgi:succinate dehydrogenase / fumarate reductase membrane anchor subunit
MSQDKPATLRTPFARVRHLGSARTGTKHFWHERLTAVAAIPLSIAFIIILMALMGRNHAAVVQILGSPVVSIIMLLFILNSVYHMWLGMQVIIEDYVHHDVSKIAALMANTFFSFVISIACVYAILKLSFGV